MVRPIDPWPRPQLASPFDQHPMRFDDINALLRKIREQASEHTRRHVIEEAGPGEKMCRLARDLRHMGERMDHRAAAYRKPCPTGLPSCVDARGQWQPPRPSPCANGCTCDRREAERTIVMALAKLAVHIIDLPKRIPRGLRGGFIEKTVNEGGGWSASHALPIARLLPPKPSRLEPRHQLKVGVRACRFGCKRCRVYETAEGIGGRCERCGTIHGWVTRDELLAATPPFVGIVEQRVLEAGRRIIDLPVPGPGVRRSG